MRACGMSIKHSAEYWILKSIKAHQQDLHLLFTNDVETMDIYLYNDIILTLETAKHQIEKAIANHEARKAAFLESHPEVLTKTFEEDHF